MLIVFLATHCLAQEPQLKFEHLGPDQGLSHQTVTSIYQDHLGFLWFGTIDGLNRFDGYQCVVYKHDPEDPTSISSSFIHAMLEDGSGNLWIGTRDGGLSVLKKEDRASGIFTSYRPIQGDPLSLSHSRVESLYLDRNDRLWVGTQAGLARFDETRNGFIKYRFFENIDASVLISCMLQTPDDMLWASSSHGLFRIDLSAVDSLDPENCAHVVTRYQHNPDDPQSVASGWVYMLFLDRQQRLWLGTRTSGITLFDRQTGKATHFVHDPSNPRSVASNYAAVHWQDRKGRLWVTTDGGGVNIFNPKTETFYHYRHDTLRSDSLSDDRVTRIYQSADGENGSVWVSTWGGGVNKLIQSEKAFDRLRHDPYSSNSLIHDFILAVEEDQYSHIWVGTAKGLSRLNPATNSWWNFTPTSPQSERLSHGNVWSIESAQNGNLWVGTEGGGLNQILLGTQTSRPRFVHHVHNPEVAHSIAENNVKVVFQDQAETLWLGYENFGMSFSRKSNDGQYRWQHLRHDPKDARSLPEDKVRSFFQDRQGRLWVGTLGQGLAQVLDWNSNDNPTFQRYPVRKDGGKGLSHGDIRAITQGPKGKLWIATYGGGINILNPETGAIEVLTTQNGLTNDFVYAILPDARGQFWVSTNRGVDCYDPQTGQFQHFSTQHGLQSDEFNTGAYLKASNQAMYFGGVKGLNRFFPEAIRAEMAADRAFKPNVVLTQFSNMGESLDFAKHLETKTPLRLAHDDKFFSFEMATLDYRKPSKNRFRYQLQGFSDSWIDNQHRRFASFTNLDPGNYVLRYQGANHTGIWHNGEPLAIVIAKPFWQTTWFRAASLVVLVLLIYLGFRFRQIYQTYRDVKYIAHFKVLKKLGKGGAGTVYLAYDRFAKRRIALKVLHPEIAETHDGVRRFLQEAEIGGRLSHPNIVKIFEAGSHGQTRYVCMEYLEGSTLKDWLAEQGALNHKDVGLLGGQVLDGIEAIHGQGVVHRDLKAANIMMLDQMQLKIMDFGLARVSNLTTVENKHQLMGTLAYMSPEQTLGKGVDVRADIYAFGCLLHEMVFGMLPYSASNEMEMIYAIHNETPRGLKGKTTSERTDLEGLIATCMEKKPQQRFATISELKKSWQQVFS